MTQRPRRGGRGSSFSEQYVAFLDILGFSELVRQADEDLYARDTIRQCIATLHGTMKIYPESELKFTQFSDCIVLSAPRNENGMLWIFDGCIRLTVALLKRGVLVRGGVAIGNLQHTKDLLFGTGLLRAYAFDRAGGPPRIVVDPAVVKDGHETTLLTVKWSAAVREDDFDLSPIVHTLLYAETFTPGSPGGFLRKGEAERIAETIAANAHDRTKPADVRSKWRWMRAYWNSIVSMHDHLPKA